MVPKKGLEPPHPCGYMDLNHARLPIPPLRQGDAPDHNPALRQEDISILKTLLNVSNDRAIVTSHPQIAKLFTSAAFINISGDSKKAESPPLFLTSIKK